MQELAERTTAVGFGTTNNRNGKNWSIADRKQIEKLKSEQMEFVNGW